MIKTITFTDVDKRNDYISIVKELGFTVNTNTYSKNSSVTHTSIYNGRGGSTTRHNSIPQYEISIEKEIDDINQETKESKELDKLKKIFFYKQKTNSGLFLFFGGLIGGTLLIFLMGYILEFIGLFKYLIFHQSIFYILWILAIIFTINRILNYEEREISNDKKILSDLIQNTIQTYLGKKGKEIIKKYN